MTDQAISNSSSVERTVRKQVARFAALVGISVGLAIAITYAVALSLEHLRLSKSQSPDRQTWRGTIARPSDYVFTPDRNNFAPTPVAPPFEPITEIPFAAADETESQVDDSELVLGVVVNDEARAYPLNMMSSAKREILNDTLGGRAIVATW